MSHGDIRDSVANYWAYKSLRDPFNDLSHQSQIVI